MASVGRSRQLARFMLFWRLRLDRSNIPNLRVRPGRVVTQEEVAYLSGVTIGYYGRLERGRTDRAYSTQMLAAVAQALQLSAAEKRVLFLLAANREPEPSDDGPTTLVSAAAIAWVLGQRWPTFITSRTFDVLVCNPAAWAWLPDLVRQPNLITLWFTPRTRAQCVDWDTRIAPRVLARLRAQQALLPDDDRLQQVVHAVLGSCQLARQLWTAGGNVSWHDDGARTVLTVPGQSTPTVVEFVSTTAQSNPDLSFTAMVPVDGRIPPPYGLTGALDRPAKGRGARATVVRVAQA